VDRLLGLANVRSTKRTLWPVIGFGQRLSHSGIV
jgi:hypothetical protein